MVASKVEALPSRAETAKYAGVRRGDLEAEGPNVPAKKRCRSPPVEHGPPIPLTSHCQPRDLQTNCAGAERAGSPGGHAPRERRQGVSF
jgi:hypothetical protein